MIAFVRLSAQAGSLFRQNFFLGLPFLGAAPFILRRPVPYNRAMLEFLSPRLKEAVSHVDLMQLYELRVRAGRPLYANIKGSSVPLGRCGRVQNKKSALHPTQEEVEETFYGACGYSVHAVENELRQGFVTAAEGERVGIAGTYVYEGKGVLSVHSVTSLCIRVPHEVKGCAEEIYKRCLAGGLCSLLLLSPPGWGKTTLLRDLSRLACERLRANVLVSDERGELSAGETGETSDVIRFAGKLTAFTAGIRAMRPDLIVTDELLPEDFEAVRRAIAGGVAVFASAHLTRYEDVREKLFSRYVLLSGLGRIKAVLDEAGNDLD